MSGADVAELDARLLALAATLAADARDLAAEADALVGDVGVPL